MPLNRIHPSKVALNYIRLLNQNKDTGKDFKLKYVPGINIFPIKEAGWFLGYVDIAYWAAWFYVVGSIFYVLDCFYLFKLVGLEADDDNPRGYGAMFNLVACILFIVNALLCFLDWWLQYKQISIQTVGFEINDTSQAVDSQFSYRASFFYCNNNLFFLAAACIYTAQGLWWVAPQSDYSGCSSNFYCGSFSINFWGAFCYLISGLFAVFEYFDYTSNRKKQGLKPLLMFTSITSDYFDWFGWGDWFYLVSGVYELYQAMDVIYIHKDDDVVIDSTYLASQSLFLVDSIFYFIGYILYCLEIKNALNTGVLSHEQFQDLARHLLPPDQQEELNNTKRQSVQLRKSEVEFQKIASITDSINTALKIDKNSEFIDDEAIHIVDAFNLIYTVKEGRVSQHTLTNPLIKPSDKPIESEPTNIHDNSTTGSSNSSNRNSNTSIAQDIELGSTSSTFRSSSKSDTDLKQGTGAFSTGTLSPASNPNPLPSSFMKKSNSRNNIHIPYLADVTKDGNEAKI